MAVKARRSIRRLGGDGLDLDERAEVGGRLRGGGRDQALGGSEGDGPAIEGREHSRHDSRWTGGGVQRKAQEGDAVCGHGQSIWKINDCPIERAEVAEAVPVFWISKQRAFAVFPLSPVGPPVTDAV